MTMIPAAVPVKIPLLNPNETDARLVDLVVHEGQRVAKGDLLCTLETTKSAADLVAERDGYVVELQVTTGQLVVAGENLCYLAESPDWKPEEAEPLSALPDQARAPTRLPEGLRITQPALALAIQADLDLHQLPFGPLVTEKMVRAKIDNTQSPMDLISEFDPQSILIYGGGGHGKSLIDLIRSLRTYHIVGILDDGLPKDLQVLGVPILGDSPTLPELYARGVRLAVNAVGGIGNLDSRVQVFRRLAQAGFVCPALIHPSAVVEISAELSPGIQVFSQAYVGSQARLGFGVIVNTGAVVSHDCLIGDYANLSPGALLAGGVEIWEGVLIGMGVTVNLGVKIGRKARIGNSATVKDDVPENGVIRAGSVWPEQVG